MAERQGFEPWIELPLYTLSKRAPSATRPSLRRVGSCHSIRRIAPAKKNPNSSGFSFVFPFDDWNCLRPEICRARPVADTDAFDGSDPLSRAGDRSQHRD